MAHPKEAWRSNKHDNSRSSTTAPFRTLCFLWRGRLRNLYIRPSASRIDLAVFLFLLATFYLVCQVEMTDYDSLFCLPLLFLPCGRICY